MRLHAVPDSDLDGRQVRDGAPDSTAMVDGDRKEIDDPPGERHDTDTWCLDSCPVGRTDIDTPMAGPATDRSEPANDLIRMRHHETRARGACRHHGKR